LVKIANRAIGGDLSLNHGAVVELTAGELTGFWYYTTLAAAAKRSQYGTRLVLPKRLDKQAVALVRLDVVSEWLASLLDARKPEFAGFEDYAYHVAYGSHQLGELGGPNKLAVWRRGIKLRLHDPTSVKMFATDNGNADKPEVEAGVLRKWGQDFGEYNQPLAKPTEKRPDPKQNRVVSEDLADAYTIARLVWVEARIRAGKLGLDELASDKERQVFLRTTKAFPINVLGREWVVKTQIGKE